MTTPTPATAPTATAPTGTQRPPAGSLGARALLALDRTQGADPASFGRRHDEWRIWSYRNQLTAHLASSLGVPIETVTAGDDPHRSYRPSSYYARHLLTVTDPHTGQLWRFIPDYYSEPAWFLLGTCPHCHCPSVPIARVAGLADLGAFCQATADEDHATLAKLRPEEFTADLAHRPGCSAGPRNHTNAPTDEGDL